MTKNLRPATTLLSLTVLTFLSACSDDGPAIRIKLVADPNINSETQVLAAIDQIELVFDMDRGFSNTAGLTLQDTDGDGQSELIFSDRVAGLSAFPLYRLRQGSLKNQPFLVSARGLVAGQLAATGDPVEAAFDAQKDVEISVPLDLRAKYRPPRVTTTLPQDGQETVPPALGFIHVVFSKWIAPGSIEGNLLLTYSGSSGARTVEGSWELINTTVTEDGLPEERTLATLNLGNCNLAPGSYGIEATVGITDDSGTTLDQNPTTTEADAFEGSFTLPGTPADEPCVTGTPTGCVDNSQCDTGNPPRFVCVKTNGIGRCVPAPTSCDGAISCPEGFECVDDGGVVTCVKKQEEPRCTKDADCDDGIPPKYICATEEPIKGQCIPAPPTCETANPCPKEYKCEGGGAEGPIFCIPPVEPPPDTCVTKPSLCEPTTYCNKEIAQCVPCVEYPSAGCEIECTKETQELKCPPETYCDLEKLLCRNL